LEEKTEREFAMGSRIEGQWAETYGLSGTNRSRIRARGIGGDVKKKTPQLTNAGFVFWHKPIEPERAVNSPR